MELMFQPMPGTLQYNMLLANIEAACGIDSDDFETFFRYRLGRFQEELKKRLILTQKDRV